MNDIVIGILAIIAIVVAGLVLTGKDGKGVGK